MPFAPALCAFDIFAHHPMHRKTAGAARGAAARAAGVSLPERQFPLRARRGRRRQVRLRHRRAKQNLPVDVWVITSARVGCLIYPTNRTSGQSGSERQAQHDLRGDGAARDGAGAGVPERHDALRARGAGRNTQSLNVLLLKSPPASRQVPPRSETRTGKQSVW